MGSKAVRSRRLGGILAGGLGALLLGASVTPAHAEDARDRQWHLDAMHADEMWKTSKGEDVQVAVIDTGVNDSLPDLKGQVLKGKDFSGRSGDARTDYDSHGTGMALLVAGAGKAGSYGLAPASRILPVRVDEELDAKNQAEADEKFAKSLSSAIRYAADSDAKIINVSMGSEGTSAELDAAVKYALAKGKMVFASVGNSGDKGNPTEYPAATPGVIGVAAIDRDAKVTAESERGSQVDLAAPGKDISIACASGKGFCKGHGTSDASAIAAASAALVWSRHPDWTGNQVTRVLVNTAGGSKSGRQRTDLVGYGGVRPRIALKDPGDPGDPKTNPLPGPYHEGDESSGTGGAEADGKGGSKGGAAASHAKDGGMSAPALAGYGLAAALVLGAAVGTPLVLARRRRAA